MGNLNKADANLPLKIHKNVIKIYQNINKSENNVKTAQKLTLEYHEN